MPPWRNRSPNSTENGAEVPRYQERDIAGGTISSTVRALGEWEVELIAIGKRNDWQATVQARISLQAAPV